MKIIDTFLGDFPAMLDDQNSSGTVCWGIIGWIVQEIIYEKKYIYVM